MIVNTSRLVIAVSSRDHVQGSTSAIVTLVEYGDYQCPACAAAHPFIKRLQQQYARDLRFVYRNFPLTQIHPFAMPAAEIAEATAAFDRFWLTNDWLYENQDSWSPVGVPGIMVGVRRLGIDDVALQKALRDEKIVQRIRNDFKGGVRSGVNGTPSLFVNGLLHQGGLLQLNAGIDDAIASARELAREKKTDSDELPPSESPLLSSFFSG